jgi:hypothetical protein
MAFDRERPAPHAACPSCQNAGPPWHRPFRTSDRLPCEPRTMAGLLLAPAAREPSVRACGQAMTRSGCLGDRGGMVAGDDAASPQGGARWQRPPPASGSRRQRRVRRVDRAVAVLVHREQPQGCRRLPDRRGNPTDRLGAETSSRWRSREVDPVDAHGARPALPSP